MCVVYGLTSWGVALNCERLTWHTSRAAIEATGADVGAIGADIGTIDADVGAVGAVDLSKKGVHVLLVRLFCQGFVVGCDAPRGCAEVERL